jgi:hypothetical protein
MNPFLFPQLNKKAMVFNMSKGDSEYEKLLSCLSTKELRILHKHDDLISKVRGITKMTKVQLLQELEDEYELEVDKYTIDDMWLSCEKLEDAIPDWFSTSHCGWSASEKDGEFVAWAREFLMQEVRINLWIRYQEYKKEHPEGANYGMYL